MDKAKKRAKRAKRKALYVLGLKAQEVMLAAKQELSTATGILSKVAGDKLTIEQQLAQTKEAMSHLRMEAQIARGEAEDRRAEVFRHLKTISDLKTEISTLQEGKKGLEEKIKRFEEADMDADKLRNRLRTRREENEKLQIENQRLRAYIEKQFGGLKPQAA